MDLLEVFTKSITNRRRASMSDYDDVKTMVTAAATLAHAAQAEMARVEAEEEEEERGLVRKGTGSSTRLRRKRKKRVKKGATVDSPQVSLPHIEITDVDGTLNRRRCPPGAVGYIVSFLALWSV